MTIEINATIRNTQGTGASRRLRHAGRVPGVVYGLGDVVQIDMEHNSLWHQLRSEKFHASVLDLVIDGKKEPVMLRAFNIHPFRQQVMHIDLLRVDLTKPMHINVPLHFVNGDTAPGVKAGGKISHVKTELDVVCLPKDLPGSIEVDLSHMTLGHSIHITDLVLPKGVTLAAHGSHTAEAVVATVQVPRGAVEAAAEEAAAAA
ncbi:MAG: 50S ribosomal protein L25/general stress protein Ctc, partial [Gallionella sp.]